MKTRFNFTIKVSLIILIAFLFFNMNLSAQDDNETNEKLNNLKGEVEKITIKTSKGEMTFEGRTAVKMFKKLKEGLNSSSVEKARSNCVNNVTAHLQQIAADAQGYYIKPTSMGGGNRSFIGYSLFYKQESNSNGTYSIISLDSQEITLRGIGNVLSKDGINPVMVTIVVTPITMLPTINYN